MCAVRRRVVDEFTHLPISPQRRYQLRRQRDNGCSECGEPAIMGTRCLKHLVKARERQRKKFGLKRRYFNTVSYKLQQGMEAHPIPAPQAPVTAPQPAAANSIAKSKTARSAPKPKAATPLPHRQVRLRSRPR